MKALAIIASLLYFLSPSLYGEDQTSWNLLSQDEILSLDRILAHWETWVPERKAGGTAPLMTFEELYQGLEAEDASLLDRIRKIDPQKSFNFQGGYLGESRDGVEFVRLEDQWIHLKEEKKKLDPQYLPKQVYEAYHQMNEAMKRDLGKQLLVESGYRSPAYQLYTFCFFMPKHGYSLAESGKWIAIPGYSEHGAPKVQAIDFINEEGVNGEDRVEDFEALPEYRWLLEHAGQFGFELSYPRDKPGITFEPWHWRYPEASGETAKSS